VTLVDNSAYSFGFQIDNGIPIIPFYDDKEDDELLHLFSYLEVVSESEDIRVKNRIAF
jgi:CTD small phosphatase-like protein 2